MQIATIALGRPRYAHEYKQDQELCNQIGDMYDLITKIPQMSVAQRLHVIDDMMKSVISVENILLQWSMRIHEAAHRNKRMDLLKLVEKIEEARLQVVRTGSNKKAIMENLLLNI